ncbi:unnamed protein product [Ophioblennius macclurei]
MLKQFSIPTCRYVLFCLLLLVYHWKEAACSLGEGRGIWQQPKLDPAFKVQPFLHDTFPSGFLWGSGTSAFQTEGASNQGEKDMSIWDNFTRMSGGDISITETAIIASDSYNRWEEDIEALQYLGVSSYSFSLSWPRIFPDGSFRNPPDMAAVEHYNRIIEALLEKNIEPIVTLYHWDLPQKLQEKYGGWKNDTLVELFEGYAAFCFSSFGSRVKYWITMHNPYLVAVQGYGTGVHAPGEKGGPAASLIVAHNLIKAHAKAWHIYNDRFRTTQKGEVSIVLGSHWVEPQRGRITAANVESCQHSIEAVLGWFAHPIFGNGDYPMSMKIQHGSLLPEFSPEEKLWVQKTADFFALSFGPNNFRLGHNLVHNGQTVTPDLRRLLSWIKLEYGNPRVLVAEGGWFSEANKGREDTVVIYLMKTFLNQVLQAVKFDGVQLFGYIAWSLVDGFEWNYFYTIRRGLFYIDFHRNLTRIPKTSALYYKNIVANNGFPKEETPTEVKGHLPCAFHWGIADSTLQVSFYPFSPQFVDPRLYTWNVTGDGSLRPVAETKLRTRGAQCTDFLAIRTHLRLLEFTGASHYRFALNWSLILPHGDRSTVNTEALRYYRCVVMELKRLQLEAVVVMYHPTHHAANLGLPVSLHTAGGWLNHSTVEIFQEYAALCYQELGSWVRYWITINEPNRLVDIYQNGKEEHQAAHNLLLAHAKAWRLYERDYYSHQQGLVSLALHADWAMPANPYLESHSAAAERFLLFELGRFLDPLLETLDKEKQSRGDYPQEMKMYLEERARVMGLPGSPLPVFTNTEKKELRGAMSFIALNHFTTRLVSPSPYPHPETQNPPSDHDCLLLSDPTWPSSGQRQAIVPWGLRKMLSWVNQRYGGAVPIILTGSGVDDQAPIEDKLRQHYIRSYVQEALRAVHLDGVNLQGFYVWKLQDRHAPDFGLFTSTQQQSRAKASIAAYKEIITHRGLADNETTAPCKSTKLHEPCSVCTWMLRNKTMLIFGGCLLMTTTTLIALIIFVIMNKKKQTQRNRRKRRRKRRNEGVSMCLSSCC